MPVLSSRARVMAALSTGLKDLFCPPDDLVLHPVVEIDEISGVSCHPHDEILIILGPIFAPEQGVPVEEDGHELLVQQEVAGLQGVYLGYGVDRRRGARGVSSLDRRDTPSWKGSAAFLASQVAGRSMPAPIGADAVVPSST